MWGPGQCHQLTWMGINSGLFPPCVLTQYYLYPINAFLTALGMRPDLFIFKVFTQEAGPSITFNAKYTSGHTKCHANLFLLQFMCLHFWCEGENHIRVNGTAALSNIIVVSAVMPFPWCFFDLLKEKFISSTLKVKGQELSAKNCTHALYLKDYYTNGASSANCVWFQKWNNWL